MTQPDRFARMVRKEQRRDDWGVAVVSVEDVVNLLRKEHAWMRRMVKAHLKLWEGCARRGDETNQYGRDCRAAQCREILQQLAQRRK